MLTFFKSKKHFLDSWKLFKAKVHTCLPFLNQKGTFWTAGCLSKQRLTHAYLFQVQETRFAHKMVSRIVDPQICVCLKVRNIQWKQFVTDVSNWSVWPAAVDAVFTGRDISKIFQQQYSTKYFNKRKNMPKMCEVPPLYGQRSALNSPVMYFQTFLPKFLGFAQ